MFGFRVRSLNGRWLFLGALAFLNFPLLLRLIEYLGGCVASFSGAYGERIPYIFANLIFTYYMYLVFGGWAITSVLIFVAIMMLILAVYLEIGVCRKPRP